MNSDKQFTSADSPSKPQERMPELYNMLMAPKPSYGGPAYTDGQFDDGSVLAGELKWTKLQTPSSRGLHQIPADIIHNACREKRSRGYIARMLAARNFSSTRQRGRNADVASSSQDNDDDEEENPLRSRKRRLKRDCPETDAAVKGVSLKRWRVKQVVDNHIEIMKALSQLTINMTKMPGDLKHMDLKPRLLGSDRITILQYQEQMRRVLEEEHKLLRIIHDYLRTAAAQHNLPEEEARREAEEAADQLHEYG